MYLHPRYLRQTVDVGFECRRALHRHRLVGSPRWQHLALELIVAALYVVLQRVNRVIRCAYHLHIVATHKSTSRVLWLLQQGVTMVIYLACG